MEDSTSDRKDASKKLSEEEKLYRNLMNQYVEFFNEGKITELEHLIDINNYDLMMNYKSEEIWPKNLYHKYLESKNIESSKTNN